jgi:tRNA U38,U39,U40 pseudouridine synthase TruA
LKEKINYHLDKTIRIKKIQKVSQNKGENNLKIYYHAFASTYERTYLYRMIIIPNKEENFEGIPFFNNKVWMFNAKKDFNFENVKKAGLEFEGEHDFKGFMTTNTTNESYNTVKVIKKIEFKLIDMKDSIYFDNENGYELQILITGKGSFNFKR